MGRSGSGAGPPAQAPWGALEPHWQWRAEWSVERPCLYWYLTVEHAHWAVAWKQMLDQLRQVGWLDVVPPRWWHVTLCDVGFVDELEAGAVREVATEVAAGVDALAGRLGTTRPLRLRCGPFDRFASAVACRVGPDERLAALQAAVRGATERVLGPEHPLVHRHRFRPHLSLAYANRPAGAAEVQRVLGALPAPSGSVDVDRVDLVSVTRRHRHYQWTVVQAVPLLGDHAVGNRDEVGQ